MRIENKHGRRTLLVVLLVLLAGIIAPAGATIVGATGGRLPVLVIKTRDIAFYRAAVDALARGLKARGYDPGARLELRIVGLSGQSDKDRRMVREQIQKGPRLIVALGTDATRLVASENAAPPALFGMILDPVSLGVVKTLDSPGGNFSGATLLVSPGKQIDHLLQIAPRARRIGVLYTDNDPASLALLAEARSEARRLGAEIVAEPVKSTAAEALAGLENRVDAVWLIPDPASTGAPALAQTLEWARANSPCWAPPAARCGRARCWPCPPRSRTTATCSPRWP